MHRPNAWLLRAAAVLALLVVPVLAWAAPTAFAQSFVTTIDDPTGQSPEDAATIPALSRAWVTNDVSSTITVVNTSTNTFVTSLGSGQGVGQAPNGIAANPATNRVYVANVGNASGGVSVFDATNNTKITTIDQAQGFYYSVDVNTNRNRVYAGNQGTGALKTIDGSSNLIIDTKAVTVNANPGAVAVNSTTNRVYVASGNNVAVFDGSTDNTTFVTNVNTGNQVSWIELNPARNMVYACSGNNVVVIDGATNTASAPIPLGVSCFGLGVNVTADHFYATGFSTNVVQVFSAATNTFVTNVTLGGAAKSPRGMATDNVTSRVYLADFAGNNANNVSVIQDVLPTPTPTPTATPTTTVTPTPTPMCILGDINCDGIVDIRDYGIWRQNFGQTNCGNPADLDGNCIVDIRDYGIWRANFGHTAGPARRGETIPAPQGTPGPVLLVGDQAVAGSGAPHEPTGSVPAVPLVPLVGGLLGLGGLAGWRRRRSPSRDGE
jgi:MYXO-CTERM domain-containing protein